MKLDTHGKGDDIFLLLLNFLIISMCGVLSSFGSFDSQIKEYMRLTRRRSRPLEPREKIQNDQ